jgi:hypothetical protein
MATPTAPTITAESEDNTIVVTIDGDSGVTNYVLYKLTSETEWTAGGNRSGDGDVIVIDLIIGYYNVVAYSVLDGDVSLIGNMETVRVSGSVDYRRTHYAACVVKDEQKIIEGLKYNTHIQVGTNKYAYLVDDNVGNSRNVHWWDGTDGNSAVAFSDNTTEFNYGIAGLARPTTAMSAELNAFNSTAKYGGRQEAGRYYYTYTLFDSERQVESLPATAIDYTTTNWSWSSYYESSKFPILSVLPETQTNPVGGSGFYTSNTKIRFYRTKRTNTSSAIVNPPNRFYFIGEIDYKSGLTSVVYTASNKTLAKTGGFAGVSAGDLIYVHGGLANPTPMESKVYKVATVPNNNSVTIEDDGGSQPNDTVSVSFLTFPDYANDMELNEEYEGRGSCPPSGVDCLAPFANRMYYFVGNVVYWSSAGRPEEVAQKYTLNFNLESASGTYTTSSLDMSPKLSTGMYGEARYEISELSGETVIAAYPLGNKLYLWTKEGNCGYLDGTFLTEGVRYNKLRKGIGIISARTLAETPYGLFGADENGIWLLNNRNEINRISKGVIDISDPDKDTYINPLTITNTFGIWSEELDEYLLCSVNDEDEETCSQIAYNPIRGVFSGVYAYPEFLGGCQFTSENKHQNYLTGGKTFDKDQSESLAQTLEFWMGQGSVETVKENVGVEIVYESITSDKIVTVSAYQNNIASTTGAMAFTGVQHTSSNLVGVISPHGSGRMFMIRIVIPSDCIAPILALNYIAEFIPWNEKRMR